MRLHGGSFLLGVTAAAIVPVLTRFFRPAAVQLATAGMMAFDEARRSAAEQFEILQDIAAEAKTRREELLDAELNAETKSNGRRRASSRRAGRGSREARESTPTGDSA